MAQQLHHGIKPKCQPREKFDLAGKTAIVTGSSRGIGAGIALELGSRGANVLVNYTSARSKLAAENVVAQIYECGSPSQSAAVQADVMSSEGQATMVEAALGLGTGRTIDILVHNAANGINKLLADIDEEFYDMQTNLNIKAPIFLTQKVVPHMPRGGRIVIVSSTSARMGVASQTIYAATKAANESFARVWATELGQSKGITVNCVNPGPVATDMFYSNSPEFMEGLQPIIQGTPAEARVGEVDDISPIVGFLCSEESRWVTGSTVSSSGGLILF